MSFHSISTLLNQTSTILKVISLDFHSTTDSSCETKDKKQCLSNNVTTNY